MKIGIVGLPNVGKSTLFQALTHKQVDTSNYPFATIDPNIGVIEVPDERLWKLAKLSNSKKIVPAIVEFVDIAGLVSGAAEGDGLGNKFLTHIREVDAICHIVRAFENENITHVVGSPNPLRDLEIIKTELALKDLETISKAKENVRKDVKTASDTTKTGDKEKVELYKILESLEQKLDLKSTVIDLINSANAESSPENKVINNLQLLSFKPALVIFNISGKNVAIPQLQNSISIDVGKEFAIASLSKDEQQELEEKPMLEELIKEAYKLLGLITFFTTGEDESRAWTVPANSTAKRAGRTIHSDFEEKFIRADIIFWEKLLEAGSWARSREFGWLRSEGKDYIVQNGDVIEFKI